MDSGRTGGPQKPQKMEQGVEMASFFSGQECSPMTVPVINRCFHVDKTELPEKYSERVTACYELEYIPWGTGRVITNGKSLPAVPGTVFFREPGMRVHGILPYSSYGILMDSVPICDVPQISVFSVSHTVGFLFQDVYKSYLTGDSLEQIKMAADVINILYYLKLSAKTENGQAESVSLQYHKERLDMLTRHIESRLDQHITLEELARVCNVSPSFLCRLFKQMYNETLFSYINRLRIQRAKQLLIETDRPIKDICDSCGFGNESYFYRLFKRMVCVSPTEFRKNHQQPFFDSRLRGGQGR